MAVAGKTGDESFSESGAQNNWKRYRCAVARGTTVNGALFFDYPVRLEGNIGAQHTIPSSVFSTAGIAVTREADINAKLRAESVVIEGRFSGEVIAAKRVEILSGAVVHGQVRCPDFVLHEGGVFEGELVTGAR